MTDARRPGARPSGRPVQAGRTQGWSRLVAAEIAHALLTPAGVDPAATPMCCRRTELAVAARLTGELRPADRAAPGERVVFLAEVDQLLVASWMRDALSGVPARLGVGPAEVTRRSSRSRVVRVAAGAWALAEWIGLAEIWATPEAGMPRLVVKSSPCCAVASWRAGFMAAGTLTRPDRPGPSMVQIACPTFAAALALTGTARRLGLAARAETSRGTETAVVLGDEEVCGLLTAIGAPESAANWAAARARATKGPRHGAALTPAGPRRP